VSLLALPSPERKMLDAKDPVEAALHDLANVLAASRSYAEVLHLRTKGEREGTLTESLLRELDRAGEIVRSVRRQTYRAGDILCCGSCGYTFVYRRASGTTAVCRRCGANEVAHWKPE